MNTKKFALLGVSLALLSACSPKEVLIAKPGQIGAGATITRNGASAHLMVPPSPKWPDGWNEALTVEEAGGIVPGIQQRLSFKTSKNAEIAFINIGKEYICQTCQHLNLPLAWHVKDK